MRLSSASDGLRSRRRIRTVPSAHLPAATRRAKCACGLASVCGLSKQQPHIDVDSGADSSALQHPRSRCRPTSSSKIRIARRFAAPVLAGVRPWGSTLLARLPGRLPRGRRWREPRPLPARHEQRTQHSRSFCALCQLKTEQPQLKLCNVAKECGAAWKGLDQATKDECVTRPPLAALGWAAALPA